MGRKGDSRFSDQTSLRDSFISLRSQKIPHCVHVCNVEFFNNKTTSLPPTNPLILGALGFGNFEKTQTQNQRELKCLKAPVHLRPLRKKPCCNSCPWTLTPRLKARFCAVAFQVGLT